jgi:Flp pilus assembly protein TadD
MREAEDAYASGEHAHAALACERILERAPSHSPALHLLGCICAVRGDRGAALNLLHRAVSLQADEPAYHFSLGCTLNAADEAAECYRRVLALAPGHAGAHLNLGCYLQARAEAGALEQGCFAEALAHFRAAAQAAPMHPDPWLNLGYALAQQRAYEEAERHYDRALGLDPRLALARFNRAMVLLAQGKFRQGWEDYEARWEASGFARPALPGPAWSGESPQGKTLLLYTEQGFGDAIQFVRYAKLLTDAGARVVVRCPATLKRLLGSAAGVAQASAYDEELPEYDAHCPLLSLPRLLRSVAEAIPAPVPYICVPDALAEEWRQRLGGASGAVVRVGLAWASRSRFPGAARKSIPTDRLAALRGLRGVEFFSLQVGGPDDAPAAGLEMRGLGGELHDFADTSAAIAALDLVISVDTAVAHLAGAMGKPTWTLLPFVPDWRWEHATAQSPWYPTMRLYRQDTRDDWSTVLSRVAADLQDGGFGPATCQT